MLKLTGQGSQFLFEPLPQVSQAPLLRSFAAPERAGCSVPREQGEEAQVGPRCGCCCSGGGVMEEPLADFKLGNSVND